jgi:hypothetical protein
MMERTAMAFRDDVRQVPGLATAYRAGLRALPAEDRARVQPTRPSALRGSVNIDGALRYHVPNCNRWDYVVASVVGSPRAERLYWIEVHPANAGSNLREVFAKFGWLKEWLTSGARRLAAYPKDVIWIASGRSAFHAGSPEIKRLASEGIRFVGRRFKLPG